MILISHIVDTLSNPYAVWRTLRGVEVICRDGRPIYSAGNVSVVFQVWHEGVKKSLKCYVRPNGNLRKIYKSHFLEKELLVFDLSARHQWIDCLLMPYIEGITLDEAICKAFSAEEFASLANEFDRMAEWLLRQSFAHGDLKPDNIIVRADGKMRAIDWDAAFLPEFAGQRSFEQGTAAYQHPTRDGEMFDKHIDDYSIAMISTLLHSFAVEPELAEYYRQEHEPKISPKKIIDGKDTLYEQIVDSFARRGMAKEYHIAKMLRSRYAHLFDLHRIMTAASTICHTDKADSAELDEANGLWGYRTEEGWTVAPLYDMGFEPIDGIALVRLGAYSHFITMDNRLLKIFSANTIIKPMSCGRAKICDIGQEEQIINIKELVKCE